MNRDRLHRLLSRRSKLLDKIGRLGLRFFLYRENAYFNPDLNGEHSLLQRLDSLGFEPAVVFDIGANEGRWTAFAAQIWPNADFHLFEPVHGIAERLRDRFEASARVSVHQCAIGAEDGEVEFHENAAVSSHSFVSKALTGGQVAKLLSGESAFALQGKGRIDFCKVDTEGFDLDILHSFEAHFAAQQIRIVQFEHHPVAFSYGRTFGDTFSYLRKSGYRLGKLFPEGVREITSAAPDWSNLAGPNFLAASPEMHGLFERLLTR